MEFTRTTRRFFLAAALTGLLPIQALAQKGGKDDGPLGLREVRLAVQGRLDGMDADLQWAAQDLAKSGLTGTRARSILATFYQRNRDVVDCATVDLAGRMQVIEPAAYRKSEGADISGQEQVQRLWKTGQPVLSEAFRAVEGFDAVDLEQPVPGPDRKPLGSVSVLFRPEETLGRVIAAQVQGFPLHVWLAQADGRILAATEKADVGRNLLRDDLAGVGAPLRALADRIGTRKAGSADPSLPSGGRRSGRDQVSWDTVGLYGTSWRLVVVHEDGSAPAAAASGQEEKAADAALARLAQRPVLVKALAAGDEAQVMALFEAYRKENPGIYSIQWVDATAVTRFGYPPDNSLKNYSFRSRRLPSDGEFVAAIERRQQATLTVPLVEGKKGRFLLVPVRTGNRYLGMIYTIHLVP